MSIPTWKKRLLQLRYLRRHEGRWKTGWLHSVSAATAYYRSLVPLVRRSEFEAILSIGDWGDALAPTFVYQDYSFLHLLDDHRRTGVWSPGYDWHPDRLLLDRAEYQRRSMQTLSGVFTMSEWDARHLRSTGLIAPDRVVVVGAGINVPVQPPAAYVPRQPDHEYRVLFVGRDFLRKAGDVVVDAMERLLRRGVRARLVVAGPSTWPLDGPMPSWVTFVGDAPFNVVRDEMARADLFCMPSRFEAFGIVFSEALATGVPVIGRDAFAMPEFIEPGVNGYLLPEDGDAPALADLIERTLGDEAMRRRVIERAPAVAAHASWDRVADDMLRTITSIVRP
jgi:glycosyltransferase involved in cell wall biosynthesis